MKNSQTTRGEDDGSTRSLEELEDMMKYSILLWAAVLRPCPRISVRLKPDTSFRSMGATGS
ncbi:MAG TPA: hypothetical protein VGC23_04540 [Vicinamibacterales bacterium]